MHTADAAGRHEPDPRYPAGGQSSADCGRSESPLDDARRDVPGADLAGRIAGLSEPFKRRSVQPDPDGAVDDPDGGRHGTGRPDSLLGFERHSKSSPR